MEYERIYKEEIACKFCKSANLVKYGVKNDIQYFMCKSCGRKFADNQAPEQMKYATQVIGSAINLYYDGLSLTKIQKHINQDNNINPSTSTIYSWITKYTEKAFINISNYKANVCGTWIADETVLKIDGKNIWFWDIIDEETRFLLASHISSKRTIQDVKTLILKGLEHSHCTPHTIITDKLQSYKKPIEEVLKDTMHQRSKSFVMYPNTNLIERFHGTLKDRTKIMRGLKNINTAKNFTDGWLIYYNFFRPHLTLLNKTPASKAGITIPYKNWLDIVEKS
ncbi:MAG: IS6 family transposase [Candidatus Omnitrophica bacterium]|nr:IS6 family transposase [Candidatus Omnitrophota bacterium]